MKIVKNLAYLLVLVGALNWGLIGAFHFDLVAFLFGEMSRVSRIVYILVGLSAILCMVFSLTNDGDDGCKC